MSDTGTTASGEVVSAVTWVGASEDITDHLTVVGVRIPQMCRAPALVI
jgi:hypothetical protein